MAVFFQDVANSFNQHYFELLLKDPELVAPFYSEESILKIDSEIIKGTQNIIAKIKTFESITLQTRQDHQNFYAQPLSQGNEIIISHVLGTKIGKYVTTFVLKNISEDNQYSIISQLMHKVNE